jgi:CBS domain-containing protein
MRVKNVMTKDPKFCLPSDSAQHAAGIMRAEHAGIVPVVESAQSPKIVGVVTDRDLCMNVVADGRDPRSVTVETCMTTKVVTCTPNDSVDRVTELMRDNQIRRVPVVNDRRELEGIVAMADVVERATPKATETHETLKKVSAPTEEPSKPRAQSRPAA